MSNGVFEFGRPGKKFIKNATKSKSIMRNELNFDGYNEDIVESYYWHMHFAYFIGKGYKAIKLEDYQYFSEASQFGGNIRQIKGGAIRAFQENLNQMIQLVKVHLMPLLSEVKKAEFYKNWFDTIANNDKIISEEIAAGNKDSERAKKAKNEMNEAISHIKDKWVNEVDGGRMWQMNRSATEQGLDFALLPQLFFGINLEDPLCNRKSIKEQLDEDVYPVDISQTAKEQVARFMYRFHGWLPTAIRDTQVNFKMRVSALKQFYAQLMMYANFMKPLLVEINKKSEGFEKANFYKGFESEDPDFVNMFDYSYSFVKIAGIKNFERNGHKVEDLEFTRMGLFVDKKDLFTKKHKNNEKKGYLLGEVDGKYAFLECERNISLEEYNKKLEEWNKNKVYIEKDDLHTYAILMMDFSQRRRNEIVNTEQGPQQVPYMKNQIVYNSFSWNIFELAVYREELKEESLEIISSFIDEISVVMNDLEKYANDVEHGIVEYELKKMEEKKEEKTSSDESLILGPLKGVGSLFSPLIPSKSSGGWRERVAKDEDGQEKAENHLLSKLQAVEDVWKLYSVHKKTKRFMQF